MPINPRSTAVDVSHYFGEYDQQRIDAVLGVDGVDEFTIYMAPVGTLPT